MFSFLLDRMEWQLQAPYTQHQKSEVPPFPFKCWSKSARGYNQKWSVQWRVYTLSDLNTKKSSYAPYNVGEMSVLLQALLRKKFIFFISYQNSM